MGQDAAAVVSDEGVELAGNADAVVGSLAHALQEEPGPTLPVTFGAHGCQPRVVFRLRPPERHAEVQQRLVEQPPVLDEQRDQQPADAAVSVQERVDRLELHVRESGPHQGRQVAVGMPPALQRRQNVRDVLGRGRDEAGVARPAAADPVLRAADLAGQLVRAAGAAHQNPVGFAQQAHAERQPIRIRKLPASVRDGSHVVADLLDIVGSFGATGRFIGDDVRQRGLRALDLRGDHRLLADEPVEEPVRIRHHRSRYGKAGESGQSAGVKLHRGRIHAQRHTKNRSFLFQDT